MKRTRLTSWHFLLILAAVALFLPDRIKPSAPEAQEVVLVELKVPSSK